MSAYKKLAILLAAAAVNVSAYQINKADVVEFEAILDDVQHNLNDYIKYAEDTPDFVLPSGVLNVYTHMTTYTDDSYTSLFTEMDFTSINMMMSSLPWYTTRMIPIIASYYAKNGIATNAEGNPINSGVSSGSSTSASASSSSSSSASSSASSSHSSSISSKASSSSTIKSSTISSKSSSSSSNKSSNNAAGLSAGLGAAVVGAVAMLL